MRLLAAALLAGLLGAPAAAAPLPIGPSMLAYGGAASCGAATTITLNPSDHDAAGTLSGGNLTWSSSAGTPGTNVIARATVSYGSNKYYFEGKQTAGNTQHFGIGWANATQAISGDYLGDSANSFENELSTPSQEVLNNAFSNLIATPTAINVTYGIAWDITNNLLWVTTNGTTYNTNLAGTQNPATGQGGFSLAGLAAGPYFPAVTAGGDSIQDIGTVNFGGAAFAYTVPLGFSPVQPACALATATAYALTGPAAVVVGTPSTNFTAASNGNLAAAVTITPHDNGAGGSFTPGTCLLAIGNATSCMFTYTAAATGTISVSTTNSAALIDPNALSVTSSQPTSNGFFVCAVATCGNASDVNPGTFSQPFLTLGKCIAAAETSTSKTCNIRTGGYSQTTQITLGAADTGITLTNYAPDGSCTAKLDGGSSAGGNGVFDMFVVATTGITFNGLQFQNIQQSAINPVGANHGGVAVPATLIKNNCFTGFHNNGTNGGPVNVWGAQGVKILNNVCWNVEAECFNAAITQAGDSWDGLDVENNYVANAPTITDDMGAIYAWSGVGGATPGTFTWKNNYVNNYGSSANFNKCLYLDDRVSGGTVTQNICVGSGEFAAQVHGGQNNVLDGNIFDLGGGSVNQYAIIWQGDGATAMAGNTARGNIVINFGTAVQPAWFNNGTVTTAPTIANNVYFNPDSGPTANTGSSGFTDSSAHVENPLFTDTNWTYTLNPASPVFSAPVSFPGIPGGWGYPGFTIPVTTFNGQSITKPAYLN